MCSHTKTEYLFALCELSVKIFVSKLQGEFSKEVFNIDFCEGAHLEELKDAREFFYREASRGSHPGSEKISVVRKA